MSTSPRHCVIGAGFSGLPVTKKLVELGQDVDVYERNSGIGGLWHTGIYDSVHTISSKKTTEFPDFPMPTCYPNFLSKSLMQSYLADYADNFGLRKSIRLQTTVKHVWRAKQTMEKKAWCVKLSTGEVRKYDSVTIANGHFSKPHSLIHDGEFDGQIIRSSDYRDPSVLRGKRVLIVGFGNTACDICVEAYRTALSVDVSVRSGSHFIPRALWNIPVTDLLMAMPVKFDWSDRIVAGFVSRMAFGAYRRHGIKQPKRRILDELPVLNTDVLDCIRSGKVGVCPEISRFDQEVVHYVDGTSASYDIVLYAVGYDAEFPMLNHHEEIVDWTDGHPHLFLNFAAPNAAGLYFAGLGRAWVGGGPMFQEFGYLIARMAVLQLENRKNVVSDLIEQRPFRLLLGSQGIDPIAKADMRPRGYGEYRRIWRILKHAVKRAERNAATRAIASGDALRLQIQPNASKEFSGRQTSRSVSPPRDRI